eukprot:104600-Alexandrium_andersonii.AAC.1
MHVIGRSGANVRLNRFPMLTYRLVQSPRFIRDPLLAGPSRGRAVLSRKLSELTGKLSDMGARVCRP